MPAPRRRVLLPLAALALVATAWLAGTAPASPAPPARSAADSEPLFHEPLGAAGCETGAARSANTRPVAGAGSRAGVETVAVVVVFPEGDRETACVDPGGSGVDVLRRAGFAPVTSSYGSVGGRVAVCALTNPSSGEQVGCASGPSCLTCHAPDYWGYFPAYRFSTVGAGSTAPRAGTVEAWRWGQSSRWSGSSPSASTLCGSDDPPPPPPPPPATPPPTTRPPSTTEPSSGGPGGTPDGPGSDGDPSGGGNGAEQPSGSGGGDLPDDGGTRPGTTGAAGERPGTTTRGEKPGPGSSADEPPNGAREMAERDGDEGDAEESAAGVPGSSSGPASGSPGGGVGGVAAVGMTAAAVAAIAALALHARRRRAELEPAEDP